MKRNDIFDDFAAADVLVTGADYRTDDFVERAYEFWLVRGRPSSIILTIQVSPKGAETYKLTRRTA